MRIKESKLRRVLRRIILEFGESDAEVIRQSQNREKMIGIGMDMGTIGFDPNWDYATNRPLKPKKMHRLDPELQLVADIIKDDFEELFALYDTDESGFVDIFEFKFGIQRTGLLENDLCDTVFESMDANEDGQVSIKEFLNFFARR